MNQERMSAKLSKIYINNNSTKNMASRNISNILSSNKNNNSK